MGLPPLNITASRSRDAADHWPVSRCASLVCIVKTDVRPGRMAVCPRQCARPPNGEHATPLFGKAACRADLPRCCGTGPSRMQMSMIAMTGECPSVGQVCRQPCARCLRRPGRHPPFLHPGYDRLPGLAHGNRRQAHVPLVDRLGQHHLAPPHAEDCGFFSCCAIARPKIKTPTSLPATSAPFHHQEGSASRPPPCCWQGDHLPSDSAMVVQQQVRDGPGSGHMGLFPGYVPACGSHALAGTIRLTNTQRP
jgi:hypothetical protein